MVTNAAAHEIGKVCFVGGGTMGVFNSLVTAAAGHDCVVYEPSETARASFAERQGNIAMLSVFAKVIEEAALEPALVRVRLTDDLDDALQGADLVSESVPDRIEVKRQVHAELDRRCPPGVIVTTNSSSIPVSRIEGNLTHGERFAAFHFHIGAKVIDLVAGPRTAPEVLERLRAFGRGLGQMVVLNKKESPGYIFNYMLVGILGSALDLVARGVAEPEQVDRVYMAINGSAAGPFGILDSVGLDVAHDVLQNMRGMDLLTDVLADRVNALLTEYIDRGELGMKSGKGFYNYPDALWMAPDFLSE